MKIIDMHIHTDNKKPAPDYLIARMDKAGIYGGCVFSAHPKEHEINGGLTFEERLNEVLEWTTGYEDRLFPVLWIHPYEEDIIKKINIAAEKGVSGFKIICSDFYVYEEQCIQVLMEIASLNKPVFFHSGILWDSKVSSFYNRPLNWEALLRIKGLRFSMGHCSWPWIDECIALYGKFLNSLLEGDTAEMFFDITPGTPRIYRKELIGKLYAVGYDTGNNIMFGTDSNASNYSVEWAKSWLETDGEIMDNLGISKKNREKMYFDNLMRFLGKTDEKIVHMSPEEDDSHLWSPVNEDVEKIIKKWYAILGFSDEFDVAFEKAVSDIKIADAIDIENYRESEDGKRNLLSYLYLCEKLKDKYAEKNIPEDILVDTLKDIVIWTYIWSDLKNELYLGECNWLRRHLSMRLFKLGRLQFCMGKAECDMADYGVKKGDNVIEIHIPEEGPLLLEDCQKSIEKAKEFFGTYYPEFQYKCFTCHSWLLDETLDEMLKPNSNILGFQNMFHIVERTESDAIFKYVFRWNTTRRKIRNEIPNSSFATKVKERALAGGRFYENLGVIIS